ncbi:aminopeptidase N [Nocardioides albus]|uniref:Aminopeptidase N n=1 Tax=Nocardioides albus TaxID=1841 RepID=A0A7W5F843_9ACTN|nr:aminopeptidase N [Nocardioides albus]MBB3088778.1 aminopeptidase N [Nocardioides albus]
MSLTLDEARTRAGLISSVSYSLDLDVTGLESFHSRTRVRFRSTAAETFLELKGALTASLLVNGTVVEAAYDGGRLSLIGLSTETVNEVEVVATLPYTTDGDGMHTFTDPADGLRYVSAYLGMDNAAKVVACFDQTDLKASFAVSVTADPADTVLANGAVVSRDAGRWVFATTPPIPPALLVVAAGRWHSVRWSHAGLEFGWHARRSLAAELDRDAAELRRTTEACFAHYADLIDEPFPFDSYDQVFVPGLNWGAQEMPGCVTYRDELLPRGAITDTQRAMRAVIIAHEMSHMWFGDSMTMTWWEDTWLQESFADYMGYRVAEAGAGFSDLLVEVEIRSKPWGYRSDARRSTHPVAPLATDVPDVDTAATIFDGISYAKGGACLVQLAFWLGDEEFMAGVNRHLTRFRFANATLADFVESLAASSSKDVRGWVDAWLRQPGFDTVSVRRDGDVPVLEREGSRPHAFTVAAYDSALQIVGRRRVELGAEPLPLPELAGLAIVPNAGGETFAALRFDPASWETLSAGLSRIEDPLVRAVLWSSTALQVRSRDLSADDFLDLVEAHLPTETRADIIQGVLSEARTVVIPQRVPASQAAGAVARVAAAAAAGLAAAADDEQRALAWAATLAATSADAGLLRTWLDDDRVAVGVPLLPTTRWEAVVRLASLGEADARFISAERDRDGTVEGDLGALRALAARPSTIAKDAAREAMLAPGVDNRRFGSLASGMWVAEQAHLLRPYVAAYLAEAPGLARRGQAFALEVGRAFPRIALDGGQLDALRTALAGDVPTILRRSWEDHFDDRE